MDVIPSVPIDCITYEEILLESLIEVKHGDSVYAFDASSLAKHYATYGVMENPFTRIPLSEEIKSKVIALTGMNFIVGVAKFTMLGSASIGELILQAIRHYGTKSDITLLTELNILVNTQEGQKSLYDYNLSDVLELHEELRNSTLHIRAPTTPLYLVKMKSYLESVSHIDCNMVVIEAIDSQLKHGSVKILT